MAYSELIKNFSRIRDYMRDFYVYGFKRRREYDAKSARSYDNERRRIESWIGDYMAFRQDSDGKSVFISIDSRSIIRNPLFKAFKAKSFTAKDIMLNFFLLDALNIDVSYTVSELVDRFYDEYAAMLEHPLAIDESTVRLKLREYEKLGLLISEKRGKQLFYRLSPDDAPLPEWGDALAFFSEEDPLGVIGSFLLDKLDKMPEHFRFKHHFILHALESEVLCGLIFAIGEQRLAEIEIYSQRRGRALSRTITPLKILISTQGGRRYLLAHARSTAPPATPPAAPPASKTSESGGRMELYRLDSIKAVKLRGIDESFCTLQQNAVSFMSNLWGVSTGKYTGLDHIEMTIRVGQGDEHIPARMEREKRCGRVEALGDGLHRFTADAYDAAEMLPWLRTFIGRIVSLECSNKYVRETFLSDLRAMEALYGNEGSAE